MRGFHKIIYHELKTIPAHGDKEAIKLKHYTEDYKIEHNIKEEKEFEDLQRELAAESKPVEPEKPKEETINYISKVSRNGKVNRIGNLREKPEPESNIINVLAPGSAVVIKGSVKDYFEVEYKTWHGYIKKNCVTETR